ncbi:RNA methyltransferase [Synechococcus sp. PCC 7336]|uniref:RNA methyltransferase n=1 Tax=Synechococcus sp. PCC 7336 TaxID=195250 RepID=UPI0003489DAA|nr:RNA methyltransferase [Synechococcus sp. PCC 7336]
MAESDSAPPSVSVGDRLSEIRIVLVEPAGPLNLGAIARVMKNMGLTQLVLVSPHCRTDDPEALRMAVHAADVLEAARQVHSLPEALVDCRAVAGTVGRNQPMEFELFSPRAGLPLLLRPDRCPAALVFGPEDRGLNNRELAQCQQQLCIPTSELYASLNLAQAVGICAYELRQLALQIGASPPSLQRDRPLAPTQVLDGFYAHLEQLLLQIGFLYPHTVPRKLRKFRRLFDRAGLSLEDVALLRGVLRQLAWADRQRAGSKQSSQGEDTTMNGEG